MSEDANVLSRAAWEANAAFWDERMGDNGNDFVNLLIWPHARRLLDIRPGERVLDVACGNGLYARRLAALGAWVTAFDFSAAMLDTARQWPVPGPGRLDYHQVDATDRDALLALGEGRYDAAACLMALFDMADIEPLIETLPRLLRPGGRFVFAIIHPSFNGAHVTQMAEQRDEGGNITVRYSIRIDSYLSPRTDMGLAIRGQPRPQPYFHRPLRDVLGLCFRAGLVMDAIEEPAFPAEHPQPGNPLSWGANFHEFPPVLIARLRLPGS